LNSAYDDDLSTTLSPDTKRTNDEVTFTTEEEEYEKEHSSQAAPEELYLRIGEERRSENDLATREPTFGTIPIPTAHDYPQDFINPTSVHNKAHTTNNNVSCATYQQIVTGANNANSNWGRPLQPPPVHMNPRLRTPQHFFNESYNPPSCTLMQPRQTHTEVISTEVLNGRNKAIVNEVVSVNIFPKMKFCEEDDFLTRTEEKNHLSKIIVDSVGRKGVEERKSFWLGYKDVVKNQIKKLRTTTITSMKKRYTDCKYIVNLYISTPISIN
jgi:hypothetical protein